ncbi:hypothetical protein [Halobacterium litoreum]|uniref:DUF8135 domain-containing protein n=1 Tax=Halobacterium litoreum TaxID=2039234 RepID=A0ABD5NDF1_9EURY|nr:hypothetical protein [Halobacterium litoreum]UHH13933.1 hypothetical protein LT972_02785 [Halobacterium litoreum]
MSEDDPRDRPSDDESREDDAETPSGERSSGEVGPGSTASSPPGEDAPLSGLRDDVDERRGRDDDEFEELFSEMSVGEVDEDAVWEELSDAADDPVVETAPATDSAADANRDVTVVDKRLCHGCPHFADPPHLGCTHDGTTIEAEVDTEQFRVADCPVVAERREMEASDFSADDE